MDYVENLKEKFKDISISLEYFDNGSSPESMQAYFLVTGLSKDMLKNKGNTVLDLSNYLYRAYGFNFLTCPEYNREGSPKNSLAFYVDKQQFQSMERVKDFILKKYEASFKKKSRLAENALFFLRSVKIK